jgi:DNA-directed RNA polymerase subunit M/transcription elongation factor TFIIS
MLISTTIALLNAFKVCPKCENTMTVDGFEADEHEAVLRCKCGWKIEVKESKVDDQEIKKG